MKNYSQVRIEAQSKLTSLRQEAQLQQQVGSKASGKAIGITSAISIGIILLITIGLNFMQQSVEVTTLNPEIQLSIIQQDQLMVESIEPQFLEATIGDMFNFLAEQSPETGQHLKVQSLDLEIEHFQTTTKSTNYVANMITATKPLHHFLTTANIENKLFLAL